MLRIVKKASRNFGTLLNKSKIRYICASRATLNLTIPILGSSQRVHCTGGSRKTGSRAEFTSVMKNRKKSRMLEPNCPIYEAQMLEQHLWARCIKHRITYVKRFFSDYESREAFYERDQRVLNQVLDALRNIVDAAIDLCNRMTDEKEKRKLKKNLESIYIALELLHNRIIIDNSTKYQPETITVANLGKDPLDPKIFAVPEPDKDAIKAMDDDLLVEHENIEEVCE